MILRMIKLASIVLLLFITGCTEKDELTLPVTLKFKIDPGKMEPKYAGFPYVDYFSFTEGQMGIKSIQFEGKREYGDDIFFETDPRISYSLELRGKPVTISDFNVPQGIYNYMKWNIFLKKIVTDELIEYNDTDSSNPGLVLKGYFNQIWYNEEIDEIDSVSKIPFLLAIDEEEQFSFRTISGNENTSIVLSDKSEYSATLALNLLHVFDAISRESVENAETSGDSLNQKIIISRNKNKYLYEIILYRLATSTRVYIY
jgi:hypothetical protein